MNWADITIISIILISAVISLFRGFVREVLSLVAWIAAFWAAATLARPAATWLEPYISIPTARIVLAFVIIMIACLLTAGVINYLVGRLIAKTGLTSTDRLLGALFGVLRGAAIVVIGVFMAGLTQLPGASWWQQSRVISPFERVALVAIRWLPPDVGKHFSY